MKTNRYIRLLVWMIAGSAWAAAPSPDGQWRGFAAREEIRPRFEALADGRLRIATDGREGLDGHWARLYPVEGGRWYRFQAWRRAEGISVPRRCVLARIQWRDANGKPVHLDAPGAVSFAPGVPPVAEPEYPNDEPADASGWVELRGVYQAPSQATQAFVELHLRWAANASVEWRDVALTPVDPPPARKVRIATVHYVPRGGKSAQTTAGSSPPCSRRRHGGKQTWWCCPKRSRPPPTGCPIRPRPSPFPDPRAITSPPWRGNTGCTW